MFLPYVVWYQMLVEITVVTTVRDSLKWRLWNGQAQRALSLITKLRLELANNEQMGLWDRRAGKHFKTPHTYARRNRNSVIIYAARYRAGKTYRHDASGSVCQSTCCNAIC